MAYDPVSALGSYGLTARVHNDGETVTFALYNELSFGSMFDNKVGNTFDNTVMKNKKYIFIWTGTWTETYINAPRIIGELWQGW